MNLSSMSRDEKSLILFLETCAVDHGGSVDLRHMNEDDHKIAENWKEAGLIQWGRIFFKQIKTTRTQWVVLSDRAMKLAHEERVARSKRMLEDRKHKYNGYEEPDV